MRAKRPTHAMKRTVATSVAATAGSSQEERTDWTNRQASGDPASWAGQRPGQARSRSRLAREDREMSPTRSLAGARPRRLTRSALDRIDGGPTTDHGAFGGTASLGERVELSAAAKKDLSAARWLTERL